jgi:hypothetical protein
MMRSKSEIEAQIKLILPKKRIRKDTKVHPMDYFIGYKTALKWVLNSEGGKHND